MEGQEKEIIKSRLGNCEVCNVNASKYSCPRCELKTCSLNCSKLHKTELDCNGIRDRTKYIPLNQMTSLDFMNDYYFIEEASRFTKGKQHNKKVKNDSRLNHKFIKLRKQAFNRNIRLYFINSILTKRKRNRSEFKAQEQTIYWHVEIIFPNACNYKVNQKTNENMKIEEIINKIINDNCQSSKELEFYKAEGTSKLKVLLKAEGLKRMDLGDRFFELNSKRTLKSNLGGRIIIEYPTIFVVLSHSVQDFAIMTNESLQDEMKNFKRILHEEVLSKKIGENPPLILEPEEVPMISESVDGTVNETEEETKAKINFSDNDKRDDYKPINYFF
ncbi:CLUMA_CG000262, isoform A [Clunio marinus]|uniref:Box C/D snoRNA protein 1 n=1 Tax=Clunio marinus TaxID=568069 RepID=A0A1J1HJ79_9DIPT|nr:CLUMA_CG000262, isoform A [Clunio marinus]